MPAATSVIRINKGENFIYRRFLKDKNLNPVPVSAIVTFIVELRQGSTALATLTYPSANCRAAASTVPNYLYIVEIEFTQTVSALLQKGELWIKTTAVYPDSDFVTDINQRKIEEKKLADVE
jgi:hypothetical protein